MPPTANIRRTPVSTVPTVAALYRLFGAVPQIAKRSFQVQLEEGGADDEPAPEKLVKLLIAMGLILLGGVFAGLTLALMGSDDLNLRVLAASSSDPKEREAASKVLRLLRRGRHWVLVVLLLGNVIVNESLPIILDPVLGGGTAAVIVSTIMIVIFGEVIPQAVCVRYGLAIGGACAPMVHALMILFAPVAWPIAKLLDWALGHDAGHTYKKAELKSFLQFHREGEEPLRDDEIHILNGVLSLNERRVQEIMTPIEDCLTLSADKILDHEAVDEILLSGFSRIPVHEAGQPDNFVGMLLVKGLVPYNPDDEKAVSSFRLLPLPEATPDLNCFQALDYFQTGRAHLLLISETPGRRGGAIGILSLEDLIEEIIGEEIIDETDRYQDNHSKRKAQRKATANIMRGIIERQKVINAFSRRPSAGRSQSPHPATRSPREGLLVRLDDDSTLTGEPTTLQGSNSHHGSPEVNMILPPSTGGVEVIIEPTEVPDEDGKESTDRLEPGSSAVKTPSPLGEHGDGTEHTNDANGGVSSKDATAKDNGKAVATDSENAESKDDSKGDIKSVAKSDDSKADSKDDPKEASKDTTNGDKSTGNGNGNKEPKRGRNKKKGKK